MDLSELETHIAQHPQSPLFARLAMEYLSAGRSREAIEICQKGLRLYPSYAAGHLVLAKCYAQEASFALALSSLEETKKYVSRFPLYDTLFYEWTSQLVPPQEEIAAPEPHVQESESKVVSPVEPETTPNPPVVDQHEGPELSQEGPKLSQEGPKLSQEGPELSQEGPELSQEGPELSHEELEQTQRPADSNSDEWRIVSRTLAEIFAMQGEYDEAIVTYRLLIQEQPDQTNIFQSRIEELIKLREAKMIEDNERKSPDDAGPS